MRWLAVPGDQFADGAEHKTFDQKAQNRDRFVIAAPRSLPVVSQRLNILKSSPAAAGRNAYARQSSTHR
jgi:hypothetical protein